VESEAYLFADDIKIFRLINSIYDQQILQNDLIKVENWSEKMSSEIPPGKIKKSSIQLKMGLVMP
jgi:hypothetical protein